MGAAGACCGVKPFVLVTQADLEQRFPAVLCDPEFPNRLPSGPGAWFDLHDWLLSFGWIEAFPVKMRRAGNDCNIEIWGVPGGPCDNIDPFPCMSKEQSDPYPGTDFTTNLPGCCPEPVSSCVDEVGNGVKVDEWQCDELGGEFIEGKECKDTPCSPETPCTDDCPCAADERCLEGTCQSCGDQIFSAEAGVPLPTGIMLDGSEYLKIYIRGCTDAAREVVIEVDGVEVDYVTCTGTTCSNDGRVDIGFPGELVLISSGDVDVCVSLEGAWYVDCYSSDGIAECNDCNAGPFTSDTEANAWMNANPPPEGCEYTLVNPARRNPLP